MLKCEIKVKHNYRKMESLPNKLINKVQESLEGFLNNIRGYAIRLERRT